MLDKTNTSSYCGVNPNIFDNSRRTVDYNKYDQVYVIDLSNYQTDKKVPFLAVIKKVTDNTVVVQCIDNNETFELYDYQFADRTL